MEKVVQLLYTHLTKYPGMQPEDCIKLLYQSVMGPGHSIEDEAAFAEALRQELATPGLITAQPKQPEALGEAFARIYLSGLERGPSVQTLTRLCALSAKRQGSAEALREKLACMRTLALEGRLPFDGAETAKKIDEYIAGGCPALHHSARYRGLYAPHYRVLARDIAAFAPVFAAIDGVLGQKPHVLVGIDGMSGAGKSGLGELLQSVYGCGVVHADDFFLQQAQRSAQRLIQPGGNIDYERLAPVVELAAQNKAFCYAAYNCQTGNMHTQREIPATPITVLEGVYALHPAYASLMDVKVFLHTDAACQRARIVRRSPGLAQRFFAEWIPLENRYFSELNIREGCDVVLDTTTL